MKIGVGIAGLALVLTIGLTTPSLAATTTQPDGIITEWLVGTNGAELIAQDTHDTGTGTITATFSPSAVNGVPNLTQPDNVQALVAAMKAPDWGAATSGGNYEFSPTLVAKIEAAGVNIGWVYQRLYALVTPDMPGSRPWSLPPWVPSTPQAVYMNGKGPVSQYPKAAAAQPTPVVVQHPHLGTQTESGPLAANATHLPASTTRPAKPAAQLASAARPEAATPAQQIAWEKAQEARNAVVAIKPSPKAPAVLVPGAHIAPGWLAAQKTIERVRAAEQLARQKELAGAALAALVGLFVLLQRVRHAWPFRRRGEAW